MAYGIFLESFSIVDLLLNCQTESVVQGVRDQESSLQYFTPTVQDQHSNSFDSHTGCENDTKSKNARSALSHQKI